MRVSRGILIVPLAAVAAGTGFTAAWVLWPSGIPDELSGTAAVLQADGWVARRRHPLTCREAGPHVHFISSGGTMRMTVTAGGRVRLR